MSRFEKTGTDRGAMIVPHPDAPLVFPDLPDDPMVLEYVATMERRELDGDTHIVTSTLCEAVRLPDVDNKQSDKLFTVGWWNLKLLHDRAYWTVHNFTDTEMRCFVVCRQLPTDWVLAYACDFREGEGWETGRLAFTVPRHQAYEPHQVPVTISGVNKPTDKELANDPQIWTMAMAMARTLGAQLKRTEQT